MRTLEQMQTASPSEVEYPPSYLDRLMLRVRRLRVPYWLVYLALFGI